MEECCAHRQVARRREMKPQSFKTSSSFQFTFLRPSYFLLVNSCPRTSLFAALSLSTASRPESVSLRESRRMLVGLMSGQEKKRRSVLALYVTKVRGRKLLVHSPPSPSKFKLLFQLKCPGNINAFLPEMLNFTARSGDIVFSCVALSRRCQLRSAQHTTT